MEKKLTKVKCVKCLDVIESKSRYDFKTCKCGAISIDGGSEYLRCVGNPEDFDWDFEPVDPRQLKVSDTSAKKSEVVDRTVSERKYCAIDQFYYSEMFTCPICYGVQLENERIIKLLESKLCWCVGQPLNKDNGREELMKHMNCDWEAMMIEYHVELIKGEQK